MTGSRVLLVLPFVLLPTGGCHTPAEVPDPATDHMETQVAEKIRRSREAVLEAPSDGDRWGKLGLVFHAHGLYVEAERCYAKASELSPHDFRWLYYRAEIERGRDPAEALERVEGALNLAPSSVPLLILRGELLEQTGDPDAATKSYARALEADASSARAELSLGRRALATGDLELSQKHLERAAALQPQSGAIQAFLARLYRRQGQHEDSRRASERARSLEPDVADSNPLLEAMSREAVSTRALQARARYEEAARRFDLAERLHARLAAIHPRDPEIQYNYANFLGRRGRLEEAEARYRSALVLDAKHVPTLVNLGNLLVDKGVPREGRALLERAVELEPERASALVGLSNALAREGRVEEASRLLVAVLDSEPGHVQALQGLSQLRALQGDFRDAVALLERAIAEHPGDGRSHFFMALTRMQQGEPVLASLEVRKAENLGYAVPEAFLAAVREAAPEPKAPQ